jgi:hypothetical protein
MRIPAGEKRKLANRRDIKREELVEERNRREGNMQREVLKRLKKRSYLTEGKTCLSIKIVFILKISGNS